MRTTLYSLVRELNPFSSVQLCATLWIVALQAPLSMGLSRQEYWSGLPFPSNFQICNTALLTIVTKLYMTSL